MTLGICGYSQKLNIDSTNAKVEFEFLSEGVKGSISGFQCEVLFDESQLGKASISGTVDARTLTTGNAARDKHLKSDDFFDASKFPVIQFISTSVEKGKNQFLMKGVLTIKDQGHPCEIKFTFKDRVFSGVTTVDANLYGVSPKKDGRVKIVFTIPLAK